MLYVQTEDPTMAPRGCVPLVLLLLQLLPLPQDVAATAGDGGDGNGGVRGHRMRGSPVGRDRQGRTEKIGVLTNICLPCACA